MDYVLEEARTAASALLKKTQGHLTKEQKDFETKQRILDSLPSTLAARLKYVEADGLSADGTLHLEYKEVSQIEKLLEQLPPVATIFETARSARFFPKETYVASPGARTAVETAGVEVKVSGNSNGSARTSVFWWSRVGGMLLRIYAMEGYSPNTNKVIGVKQSPKSKKMVSWTYKDVPTGKVIFWSHFDATCPPDISVYWTSIPAMLTGLYQKQDVMRSAT